MTANNSLFDSSAGIETSLLPAAPAIFDSTGGIMSIGGGSPPTSDILQEDGTYILQEDGTKIQTES